jgi:LEA14-like dessication related protein
MTSDKDLIESQGGATKVAMRLGCSVQRVQNWKKRGIPAQVRLDNPDVFPLPVRTQEVAPTEHQPQ